MLLDVVNLTPAWTLVYFLILVLAVDAVLVIWFRGSIFATPRAYLQAWSDSDNPVKWFIGELLTCPKCLPIHVTFWLAIAGLFIPYSHIVIFILAASGLASRIYNNVFIQHE